MPSDPTVQVAVVGIITTFITTLGVIAVAVLNNKKERTDAAQEGIEETLRERIVLRDERIEILKRDNQRKDSVIERLRNQVSNSDTTIAQLREHIARQDDTIARLRAEKSNR